MQCIIYDWLHQGLKMKKTAYPVIFGAKLREKRHERGLTQEQLAEKADMHVSYIGALERGKKNVTVTNIFRLAEALNCDPKDFFP